jgi:peptide/nickel transport system substrate-binding protein
MNGLAKPAKGQVDPSSPWFGKPTFDLKYDVAAAKKLVQEAGYSKEKPLKTTFVIAQGGTGQMLSLPMNEFLQQSFKEVGIEIDFKVVELETLYTHWRKGAKDEMNANITSNNIAYVTSDPLYAIVRFFHSGQAAPVGVNWGVYNNPKVDALIDAAKQNFDSANQDELLAQAHQQIVDDAVLVWVVHDTNPHALSPKVKKFVQAQHWFQDLTTIGLE